MMTVRLCTVKKCAHAESEHHRTAWPTRDDYCQACYEDGSDLTYHRFDDDPRDGGDL